MCGTPTLGLMKTWIYLVLPTCFQTNMATAPTAQEWILPLFGKTNSMVCECTKTLVLYF